MPLGDLGNLHVGVEIDLSGLSTGLARAQAEMKAAAEGMSSSSTTELGKVRTAYTQVGDEAERSGARARNSIRQTSDDVSRSATSISNDLGRVAAAHADMGRVSQISSEQVQSGIRAWAQSMELGRGVANLTSTDVQRGLREWSAAQNEHSNVVQRAMASIGGAFSNTRVTIDNHISGIRASLLNLGTESVTPFRNAINSIGDTDAFRRLRAGVDDVAGAVGRFGLSGVNDIRNVGSETDRSTERSHTMRSAFEIGALTISTSMLFARQRMEEFGVATEALKAIFNPVAETGRAGFERIGSAASNVASGLGRGFEGALSSISSAFENHFARSHNSVNTHSNGISGTLRLTARAAVGSLEEVATAGEKVGVGVAKGADEAAKGAAQGATGIQKATGGILENFGNLISAIPSLGGVGQIFTKMGLDIAKGSGASSEAIIGIIFVLINLAGVMSFFVTQAVGAIFIIGVFAGAMIGAATAFSIFFGGLLLVAGGIVALAASYAGWFNAGQNVQQAQSKLTTATNEHNTAVQELKKQQDSWNSSSSHSQTQLDSLQAAQQKVKDTTNALSQAQNEYNTALGKADNPLKHLTDALEGMKNTLGALAVPLAGPLLDVLTTMVKPVTDIGVGILGWFKGLEPQVIYGLQQAFLDILDIVRGLGPPMQQFFATMLKISQTPAFAELEAAAKQFLVSTIAGLLDNLAKIADWFVKASTSNWGKSFGDIFSAIGQFVQGFGAHLVEIGDWFVKHWPQIIDWTNQLAAAFEAVLPVITIIIGAVAGVIGELIKIPIVKEGIKDLAIIFGVLFLGVILTVVATVAFMAAVFIATAFVIGIAVGYIRGFIELLVGFITSQVVPFIGTAIGAIRGFFSTAVTFIGNLVDAIVVTNQGILSFFGDVLSAIGTFVSGVIGWFGSLFSAIGGVFSAIGTFVSSAIGWFGALFSGIGSAIQGIIGWFQAFGGWVGSLASAAGSAVQGVIGWFQWLWGQITGIVGFIVGWIVGEWNSLWSAAGNIFQGIVNTIVGWFNAAWGFISGLWGFVVSWVINTWSSLWSQAGAIFQGIVDTIVGWFNAAWAFISGLWGFVVSWVVNTWTGLWNSAGAIFQGIVDTIVGWFNAAWAFISGLWSFVWNWIVGIWNGIWSSASTIFQAIVDTIVGWFNAAWAFISNLWSFIWNWLAGTWNGIWNTAVQWLTNVWNSIVQFFSAIWNWLSNLWSFIWNWLAGTWNGIWTTAVQWLTNVWNSIVQWFTAAWNFISNLWSFIWNWLVQTWNGIWGSVNQYFGAIWQTISDWTTAIWSRLSEGWNYIWQGLVGIVTGIVNSISDNMRNGLNSVIKIINDFLGAVDNVLTNSPLHITVLNGVRIQPIGAGSGGGASGPAPGGTVGAALESGGVIPSFCEGGCPPGGCGHGMGLGGGGAVRGVGAGFKTNRPTFIRALTGEGLAPEYVIPTESRYHSNAVNLWTKAGRDLGLIPAPPRKNIAHVRHESGGILGLAVGGSIPTSGAGGQCLAFVCNTSGIGCGIPDAAAAASLCNSGTLKGGDVFITTEPPFGHAGYVIDANTALDSNFHLDEQIHEHPMSDIFGLGPICFIDPGSPFGGANPSGGGGLGSKISEAIRGAISALFGGFEGAMGGVPGLPGVIGKALVQNIEQAALSLVPLVSPSGPQAAAGNACQVVDWAKAGGFSGQAMYNAAAIALAESSGNPDPGSTFTPDSNGGTYGLMQFNQREWGTYGAKYGSIGDPVAQMRAAFDYSGGGRDFGPWCTSTASMNASGIGGCGGAGGATAGKFLEAVQACHAIGGVLGTKPIAFDTGYNTIPPGLHIVSNNTGVNETLKKVGPHSGTGAGGGEAGGGVHNHFHGDVRVSPELFQEAYRKADWYQRTGQY